MRIPRILAAGAILCIFGTSLFADSSNTTGKYSRWPKIRVAGFAVGGGYSHFGALGYPGFGFPYYSAFGYAPFGFFGDFWLDPPAAYYQASLGELKLKTLDKNASIFLDGGFAGNAGQLKSMWIEPGTHEVRVTEGNRSFEERIYVLTGRSLTLHPELATEGSEKK